MCFIRILSPQRVGKKKNPIVGKEGGTVELSTLHLYFGAMGKKKRGGGRGDSRKYR